MRLFLLGGFRAEVDGAPVPDSAWTRPTAKTLVKLLAVTPAHRLHREQLIDLLWPEAVVDVAERNLAKALYYARRALEPDLTRGPQSRYLRLTDAIVSLDAEHIWIDADAFREEARTALAEPDLAGLERALASWGGELLPENRYADWAMAAGAETAELAARLRIELASQLLRTGSEGRAVEILQSIVREDPAREDVHRRLMQHYAATGQRQLALRQYQLCLTALRKELGVEPDAETQAVHAAILQDAPTPRTAPERPAAPHLPGHLRRYSQAPFVGRTSAIDFLLEGLTRAGLGHGELIFLAGEAGVGKTRLAAELAQRAHDQGATVLWGASYDQEGHLPYGAIVEAIEGFFHARPAAERRSITAGYPELAALFPTFVAGSETNQGGGSPPADAEAAERTRLYAALARLLAEIDAEGPVLLVLDDLHAADPETLRVVHYLARRATQQRWLLVATYREDDVQSGTEFQRLAAVATREGLSRRIDLRRLARRESDRLAAALLPDAAPGATLLDHLFTLSLGNPLYLHALVEALRERGVVHVMDGEWQLPPEPEQSIPSSIRELIEARVDRLGESPRQILALAAVAGMRVSHSVLLDAALAGSPHTDAGRALDGLATAVEANVLQEDGADYRFRHPLFREALYQRLSRPRRLRLHTALATTLERHAPEDVEALAYHFQRSTEPEKAITYLEPAGERAAQLHAFQAAIEHYRAALALLPAERVDERARLEEKLGDVSLSSGDPAGAIGHYEFAIGAQTDALRRIELWRKESAAWEKRGEWRRALSLIDIAEATVPNASAPADTIAGLRVSRAFYLARLGELDRASELARAVIDAAGDDTDSLNVGRAYNVLGMVAGRCGNWRESEEYARRTVAVAERLEDANGIAIGWNNLGNILNMQGRHEEAEQCLQRSLQVYQRIGEKHGLAFAWLNLGVNAYEREEYQRAEECYLRSLQLREPIGDQWGIAICCVNLAEVYEHVGRLPEAHRYARRGLDLCQAVEDESSATYAMVLLGDILLGQGDVSSAETQYRRGLARAESAGDSEGSGRSLLGLARIAAQNGHPVEALRFCRRSAQVLRGANPRLQVRALLLRASILQQAGRVRAAARVAVHARELAQRNGLPRLASQAAELAATVPAL